MTQVNRGDRVVAQALHLMGARPIHDAATGRVTGIEVLPPASIGRPRVDVTFRNLPAGSILPFRPGFIRATGTTAGELLALY